MKNLVFVVTVLVAACKGDKTEPAKTTTPAAEPVAAAKAAERAAAPAQPAEPTPYKSAEGRFTQKVTFGDAKQKTLDDPNGGTWQSTSWKTPSAQLMIQYTDYESHAHAVAETQGFIPTRDKTEIKRDEKVTIAGHDGRELEWTLPSGVTMRIRFLIADKRVYKIGGGYRGDGADAQKFIDGFSIEQ